MSELSRNPFFDRDEESLIARFLEDGYIIFPLEDEAAFAGMRKNILQWSVEFLRLHPAPSENAFFDNTQDYVAIENLNHFRVQLFNWLSQDPSFRGLMFSLAKRHLYALLGNELAMQRNAGLSIQLPGDESSLLPIHSDVWDGNSPYEAVFWFPLVPCYRTRSMFILPKAVNDAVVGDFKRFAKLPASKLYDAVNDRVVWLDVPLGHGVIFSHILLHGNQVNEEDKTRWSFNVRYKGLLTPYTQKELGETFLPITIRPVTRMGFEYKKPEMP